MNLWFISKYWKTTGGTSRPYTKLVWWWTLVLFVEGQKSHTVIFLIALRVTSKCCLIPLCDPLQWSVGLLTRKEAAYKPWKMLSSSSIGFHKGQQPRTNQKSSLPYAQKVKTSLMWCINLGMCNLKLRTMTVFGVRLGKIRRLLTCLYV